MKRVVEYWQWRYRDPGTGRKCRTGIPMTEEQAAQYPDAQRIEGTMLLVTLEDFADTTPGVHHPLEPE